MDSIIIFQNNDGGLVFVYPAKECGLSIEEIALKDVPEGKPFLIVPNEMVPTDHTFFEAFEADFSEPHGIGIGAKKWFINKYKAEIISATKKAPPPPPNKIVVANKESIIFSENLTSEQIDQEYSQLVDYVNNLNTANLEAYNSALKVWESDKKAYIDHLNNMIEVQEREVIPNDYYQC